MSKTRSKQANNKCVYESKAWVYRLVYSMLSHQFENGRLKGITCVSEFASCLNTNFITFILFFCCLIAILFVWECISKQFYLYKKILAFTGAILFICMKRNDIFVSRVFIQWFTRFNNSFATTIEKKSHSNKRRKIRKINKKQKEQSNHRLLFDFEYFCISWTWIFTSHQQHKINCASIA